MPQAIDVVVPPRVESIEELQEFYENQSESETYDEDEYTSEEEEENSADFVEDHSPPESDNDDAHSY